MVEVTTARETYRYVYDALGRRTEKQHISPDGKPYNRTKFLWDGMRLAKESRPEGTSSLYIYSDQGVMNRWRGWIRRGKRDRTGYCIFTQM